MLPEPCIQQKYLAFLFYVKRKTTEDEFTRLHEVTLNVSLIIAKNNSSIGMPAALAT